MGLFKKASEILPGIKARLFESPTFSFTKEEQASIDRELNTFATIAEGYGIHKSIAEQLNAMLIAKALSDYAYSQSLSQKYEEAKDKKDDGSRKAVSAIIKAYSIYPSPKFLFEMAQYMESSGRNNESKDAYRLFLKKQKEYQPSPIDDAVLAWNVDEAVAQAKTKITY
jgi:hypothetical protein